ncbi:MAG TPA: CoA transferase, partial [Acidimicrobiales bacterium]
MTPSDVDLRSDGDPAAAWARSGMLWLTGRPDGEPLGAPRSLVERVEAWATELARRSAELGSPVVVDPLALLAQRAAVAGLARAGDVSCGGGSRLLASADGWVAASLARPTDWEAVAAWLGRPGPVAEGDWADVAAGVAGLGADELRAGAELLGLPVAVLGERERRRDPGGPGPTPSGIHGVDARRVGSAAAARAWAELVVVDLSSLWAGPLAGRLLARAGARVVKVESTTRPDGA